ncbi:MAG TPA: hypothetical protein VIK91_03610, partial [Nannocystis sp.]
MTAKQAFLEKLLQDSDSSPLGAELSSKRDLWLHDLEELMHLFQGWLNDPQFQSALEVRKEQIEIREEDLGAYTVPSLVIRSRTRHPRDVRVLPKA